MTSQSEWEIIAGSEEWSEWSGGLSLSCRVSLGEWETDYSFSSQVQDRAADEIRDERTRTKEALLQELSLPNIKILLERRMTGATGRELADSYNDAQQAALIGGAMTPLDGSGDGQEVEKGEQGSGSSSPS